MLMSQIGFQPSKPESVITFENNLVYVNQKPLGRLVRDRKVLAHDMHH